MKLFLKTILSYPPVSTFNQNRACKNGFTYVLCLYITLIGIITMLGATNIYVSKLQMEKQLQNHYLATTLTNLSIPNNISRIKAGQKTFTEKHNNAVLWYNWADSTEDAIRYDTTTELSNGYILKQTLFWDIKLQKNSSSTKLKET